LELAVASDDAVAVPDALLLDVGALEPVAEPVATDVTVGWPDAEDEAEPLLLELGDGDADDDCVAIALALLVALAVRVALAVLDSDALDVGSDENELEADPLLLGLSELDAEFEALDDEDELGLALLVDDRVAECVLLPLRVPEDVAEAVKLLEYVEDSVGCADQEALAVAEPENVGVELTLGTKSAVIVAVGVPVNEPVPVVVPEYEGELLKLALDDSVGCELWLLDAEPLLDEDGVLEELEDGLDVADDVEDAVADLVLLRVAVAVRLDVPEPVWDPDCVG
jgi:hypothetical protein